jgi:hypothetical protein
VFAWLWPLQEERAISPVGTLEYMPPEILRLPSTDLVVKGLVSVDDITPVDEKVGCCLCVLVCLCRQWACLSAGFIVDVAVCVCQCVYV